jgi:hypothetical protein
VGEQGFGQAQRKETVNAVMAATGLLRVNPWVEIPRAERESLTLEAVKLAVEGGADLNLANTDGRTALDAAKALKFDSVIKFLVENGAKAGTGASAGGRGANRKADK